MTQLSRQDLTNLVAMLRAATFSNVTLETGAVGYALVMKVETMIKELDEPVATPAQEHEAE